MTELAGKNVVVSGKIDGHSRSTAEAALRDRGAKIQADVGASTDLLVIGAAVGGKKLAKAELHGVDIVPFEDAMNGKTPATPIRHSSVAHIPAVRTVAPMKAQGGCPMPKEGFLFEIKWDGYRGVATVFDGQVALQSGSAKTDLGARYPQVREALTRFPNCVLDGELVSLDEAGNSAFEQLHRGEVSYIVFDCLEVDGKDIRRQPLEDRRQHAERIVKEYGGDRVAMSPAFDDGEKLYAWAEEQAIEGIVAKKLGSPYQEGKRNANWQKHKNRCGQEFAVIGWIEGTGNRAGTIGSVLLAVHEEDAFKFVGRAGTWKGSTRATWDELRDLLQAAPKSDKGNGYELSLGTRAEFRDVNWVEPTQVIQCKFQRWTEDGRLWHPSITGIRIDKEPADVVREPC
jgi:bifunctional non-homologous end joining protein LigD